MVAREIDLEKPLSADDYLYLRDRGALPEEGEYKLSKDAKKLAVEHEYAVRSLGSLRQEAESRGVLGAEVRTTELPNDIARGSPEEHRLLVESLAKDDLQREAEKKKARKRAANKE